MSDSFASGAGEGNATGNISGATKSWTELASEVTNGGGNVNSPKAWDANGKSYNPEAGSGKNVT